MTTIRASTPGFPTWPRVARPRRPARRHARLLAGPAPASSTQQVRGHLSRPRSLPQRSQLPPAERRRSRAAPLHIHHPTPQRSHTTCIPSCSTSSYRVLAADRVRARAPRRSPRAAPAPAARTRRAAYAAARLARRLDPESGQARGRVRQTGPPLPRGRAVITSPARRSYARRHRASRAWSRRSRSSPSTARRSASSPACRPATAPTSRSRRRPSRPARAPRPTTTASRRRSTSSPPARGG